MGRSAMANTVSLSIEPEGKTIANIPWTGGMNVQQEMELAYSMPPCITFALQYYGPSLGYLVLAVDGTFDTDTTFWFLYVNDVLSPTGIDETILNDGDAVSLVYEPYQAEKHASEIHRLRFEHAQKRKASMK
jgi:hypothetical protein